MIFFVSSFPSIPTSVYWIVLALSLFRDKFLIGAVAVLGLSEFFKCWVRRKALIKWMVFFTSLGVGVILSPLVPAVVTTLVMTWLLILAVAVLAHRTILDGVPNLIAKVMQNQTQNNNQNGNNPPGMQNLQ